jgi:hypothetical protein
MHMQLRLGFVVLSSRAGPYCFTKSLRLQLLQMGNASKVGGWVHAQMLLHRLSYTS